MDIDNIELEKGSVENMYVELGLQYGEPEAVAFVDFKMPGKSLSDKYFTIRGQINMATKLGIPFFFIITYLDDRYPVKMYYIIPINKIARKKYKDGGWLSLRRYSQFQHHLRGEVWNPKETLNQQNVQKINLDYKTLGDLPADEMEYPLPIMEFSWMA